MGTETLIKQPAESRLYSMDFAPNLDVGETLASVVRVTVDRTGLVLNGSPTYSGTKAFQRIESGSAGTNYKITFVITTSSGNTLEAEGYLQVRDL